MESTIALPALRTVQAGQATYIASAPFGFVGGVGGGPALKAASSARRISRRQAAAIAEYLIVSPEHLLPPLVLAIDGGVRFDPFLSPDGMRGCGRLLIDLTAGLSWIDGEVRAAGIAEALRRRPSLAQDTVGLVVMTAPPQDRKARLRLDLNTPSRVRTRQKNLTPAIHADDRDSDVRAGCRSVRGPGAVRSKPEDCTRKPHSVPDGTSRVS